MNSNSISRSASSKSLQRTPPKVLADAGAPPVAEQPSGQADSQPVVAPDASNLALHQPVELSAPSQAKLNDTLGGPTEKPRAGPETDDVAAQPGPQASITTFTPANDPKRMQEDTGSGTGAGEAAGPTPGLRRVPSQKKDPSSLDDCVDPGSLMPKQSVEPPQPFTAPPVVIDRPADHGAQAIAKATAEEALDNGAFFKGMHSRLADLCEKYQIDTQEMAPLFNLFADAAMVSFQHAAEATHQATGQSIEFNEPMVRKAMNLARMAEPLEKEDESEEAGQSSFDSSSGSRSIETSKQQLEQSIDLVPPPEQREMQRAAVKASDLLASRSNERRQAIDLEPATRKRLDDDEEDLSTAGSEASEDDDTDPTAGQHSTDPAAMGKHVKQDDSLADSSHEGDSSLFTGQKPAKKPQDTVVTIPTELHKR